MFVGEKRREGRWGWIRSRSPIHGVACLGFHHRVFYECKRREGIFTKDDPGDGSVLAPGDRRRSLDGRHGESESRINLLSSVGETWKGFFIFLSQSQESLIARFAYREGLF